MSSPLTVLLSTTPAVPWTCLAASPPCTDASRAEAADQSSSEEPGSQMQLCRQQVWPSQVSSHLGRKLILTLLPGLLRIPSKIMAGTAVGAHREGFLVI